MPLRAAFVGLALVLAAPAAKAQPEPAPQPEAVSEPIEDEDPAPSENTPPAPAPAPFDFDEEDPFGYGNEEEPEPDPSPDEETTGFPRTRFVWQNLLAGRYNPLGLINRFDIGFRVQIIDKPGKIYKDSQASFLLHTAVSPAFTHIGGRIEIQPLSILRLGMTYAFMGSHAAFDFVQPFDDPNAEFDDTTLDDREDLNTAHGGVLSGAGRARPSRDRPGRHSQRAQVLLPQRA